MKKLFGSLLALFLLVGIVTPSYAKTSEKNVSVRNSTNQVINEQENMINTVKPYVALTKSGTLVLKNMPQKIYEKYNLSQLEDHFSNLNKDVKTGKITINRDLSIKDNSVSIGATYGKWTYHWWGYDRKFSDSGAKYYSDYLGTLAAGGSFVTGITAWLPPVSAIAGITSSYWGLVSIRVSANNHGDGVWVGVTWVAAFDVDPL